eukprot:7595246-Pyramimonas_sp.AAC.2
MLKHCELNMKIAASFCFSLGTSRDSDFVDERVKNKAKSLRNCYAILLFLTVIFWLTSFRVMSQCFYHPCIEG